MLQRRLTGGALAAITVAALAGCGDKPIEDNLVRPAITALDQSRSEACGVNASTLRTAIDAYTMLIGDAPVDEQALIDEEFLREATDDWDIVDGELVAENPACGDVGTAAAPPTVVDIVTDADPEPMSADEIFDGMSGDLIEQVGGDECAMELAAIFAAAEQFVFRLEREPTDFEALVEEGFLDSLPVLWVADRDEFEPAADSSCVAPG